MEGDPKPQGQSQRQQSGQRETVGSPHHGDLPAGRLPVNLTGEAAACSDGAVLSARQGCERRQPD
jgi:hypothetical protein